MAKKGKGAVATGSTFVDSPAKAKKKKGKKAANKTAKSARAAVGASRVKSRSAATKRKAGKAYVTKTGR